MNKSGSQTMRAGPYRHNGLDSARRDFKPWPVVSAALLAAILLSIPKVRMVFGAPIYFIDVLALTLLFGKASISKPNSRTNTSLFGAVWIYFTFVVLSEIRGLVEYATPAESLYMLARYTLAVSVAFSLPAVIRRDVDFDVLLKGWIIGLLTTSIVVIAYSFGPTRGFVLSYIFSWDFINPGWQRLVEHAAIFGAGEAAMRGRSPIGAATMTAGFLAIAWPLSFMAIRRLSTSNVWRLLAMAASLLAPMAILMTYGRAAWIMVTAIVLLAAFFNLAGARRILVVGGLAAALLFIQVNFDRSQLLIERVTEGARTSIAQPMEDESTRERVYSFVEPFEHLMENPSWMIVGVGRTGNRAVRRSLIEKQLFEEGLLATHSGFAMAYYCFGLPAALCQVMILIFGFQHILKRLRVVPRWDRQLGLAWQALLMSWVGMSLWWMAGHAIVGEPRGAMLQFFMIGLVAVLENLTRARWRQSQRPNVVD